MPEASEGFSAVINHLTGSHAAMLQWRLVIKSFHHPASFFSLRPSHRGQCIHEGNFEKVIAIHFLKISLSFIIFLLQCCCCSSTVQTSFISVSLAPGNCVWDQRQRRCERACVFCSLSTSASPLWLHARFRHPCSCQPPDADALEDRRAEQPRVSREEAEKRWRRHVNLSGRMSTNCSAAGNVRRRHICHICFISGIIIQRWRDGKWH